MFLKFLSSIFLYSTFTFLFVLRCLEPTKTNIGKWSVMSAPEFGFPRNSCDHSKAWVLSLYMGIIALFARII